MMKFVCAGRNISLVETRMDPRGETPVGS